MTEWISDSTGLRRVPRQARSRAKVDRIIRSLLELVQRDDVNPSSLTTTDIANAADMSIGSLYEYFVDLDAVVDAAVAMSIRAHDRLLDPAIDRGLPTVPDLVDVLVTSYDRLYAAEPGMLALRTSSLYQPFHRVWVRNSLQVFIKRAATLGSPLAGIASQPDLVKRLGLFVAVTDTLLQHAYADGGLIDGDLAEEYRCILESTMERMAR